MTFTATANNGDVDGRARESVNVTKAGELASLFVSEVVRKK